MFFGCVISDLYLFQYIALLNLCFRFSNNLILSFIDKVTTWFTKILMLIIMTFTPITLIWWCSISTQSVLHDKWSCTLQFIKGKSRDLQKFLKYLSGIVTSTFKDGTDGWSTSPEYLGYGCLSGNSSTIFFE